jgi:hypothetical protein
VVPEGVVPEGVVPEVVVPEGDVSAAVKAEESLLEADALTVAAGAQGPLLALLLHYALQLQTDPSSFFAEYHSLTAETNNSLKFV